MWEEQEDESNVEVKEGNNKSRPQEYSLHEDNGGS